MIDLGENIKNSVDVPPGAAVHSVITNTMKNSTWESIGNPLDQALRFSVRFSLSDAIRETVYR